jgi:FkbM family methyltransferase
MNAWVKYNLPGDDCDNLLRIKFVENSKPNYKYCDVGACNGVITSFFKVMAGDNGFVYSFELNKYNYENIKHLNSNNCIVENLAISDKSGTVDIYSDSYNPGNHISNIIGHDTAYRKMNVIGSINSISLDEYFNDKDIDVIKIDVEGAELKVIQGAINTLKKCKYAIIECHFKSDWEQIFNILKSNNLNFKNLVDDVPIYYGDTIPKSGISDNGMPYQIYLKNN